jgi:HEPN domain-containing protein
VPGLYEGSSLSGHIHDWYDRRYGKRLNIDLSPITFPTLIRGDLYLVRVPLLVGQVLLFVDRGKSQLGAASGACNLMDWVCDLSEEIRNILSDGECNDISKDCYEALHQSRCWSDAGKPFHTATRADLRLSASLAVEGNYGLSRWHSLQAAEKALKAYIRFKGANPKRTHDLHTLARAAGDVGFAELPAALIETARCNAEVRYSQAGSVPSNCYQANRAARLICTAVANYFAAGRLPAPLGK